ncbi:ABC transporter permease [Ktedonosporobacter rubrisoli]|nr:ABC transporter permease [Ktedonosporobacter rubrisoli]
MKTILPQQTSQQRATTRAKISSANVQTRQLQRRRVLIIGAGRIVFLLCLITLWQILSGRFINPLFISSPLAVVEQLQLWLNDGSLWSNTAITLQETLLGLVYGALSGVLAGILLGIQPLVTEILDPFVIALYSIPKVALAPLCILWFGIGLEMKVVLAAVTVFFLVFFNTLTGIRNVDRNLIDAVLLMGGKHWDIVLKVMIPSAAGYILTGLRIAIPYSLIGAVVAELVSSNSGLGYLINDASSKFDTAGVFVALLVLTIIASALNAFVNLIDHKTSRWKAGMTLGKKIIP